MGTISTGFCQNAVVKKQVSVAASDIFTNIFTMNSGDFATRTHVWPDKIYFNASGAWPLAPDLSADSPFYGPPTPHFGNYPPWATNYPAASWEAGQNHTFASFFQLPTSAGQILSNSETGLNENTLLLARINFNTENLELHAYDNNSSLFLSPVDGFPEIITTDIQFIPHAMVINRHIHFLWKSSSHDIIYRSSTSTEEKNTNITGTVEGKGLGGALLSANSTDYVCFSYIVDNQHVALITFEEDDFDNRITTSPTIDLGNSIDSEMVAIGQNPRTGKIYLAWISGTYAYFREGTFDGTSFNFGATASLIEINDYDFRKVFGLAVVGFDNFETSLFLPQSGGTNRLRNFMIKSGPEEHSDNFTNGYTVAFPYTAPDGVKHAGLLSITGFNTATFYKKPLVYPTEYVWEKDSKQLHIEGPPLLGSEVIARVEFAQLATDTCSTRAVYHNDGSKTFNNASATGVLTVSGNEFSLKFGKDMRSDNYAGLMNDRVRLVRSSDNLPVTIAHETAISSNEIRFSNTTALDFNTEYRILVASDVLDANGSQIWSPTSLRFTTQTNSSVVRGSDVSGINLYRNSTLIAANQYSNLEEVNATSTVYIELLAANPAPNTFDTANVQVFRNDILLTELTATQNTTTSDQFIVNYDIAAPLNENHVYRFQSPGLASAQLVIDFPEFEPASPTDGETNVSVNKVISLTASEQIKASEVTSANIRLINGATQVPASLNYDGNLTITITPQSPLLSETIYRVEVDNQQDSMGNPQITPLGYTFSTEDIIPPTLVLPVDPAAGSTGVKIDKLVTINFSEPILASTANTNTILLTRNGNKAGYSVSTSGSQVILDPDDNGEGYLRPQTEYTLSIGPGITDLAGNPFSNSPATYSMTFITQPRHTTPVEIESISLWKNMEHNDPWADLESIPASATIHIKVTGTDGEPLTQDIATITLDLSWAGSQQIILEETASSSSYYAGSIDLATLNLYGFPSPLPPTTAGTFTFSVDQEPTELRQLKLDFPEFKPTSSSVTTIQGSNNPAGATGVKIDTNISLVFDHPLKDIGAADALLVTTGATAIPGSKTLSGGNSRLTFVSDAPLPFAANIRVRSPYSASGLQSPVGNPLYRAIDFNFTTQAEQTPPTNILALALFPDDSYSSLNVYQDAQYIPATGNIYIQLRAEDAADNTQDFSIVETSLGDNIQLTETTINSGIFRGIFNYSNLPDNTSLDIFSQTDPAYSRNLVMLLPTLELIEPLPASTNVSAATSIRIKANKPLDTATIDLTTVKLLKLPEEVAVVGDISYDNDSQTITFDPDDNLEFATTYRVVTANIKDPQGNSASAELSETFTTQLTAVPPTTINAVRVFSDDAYSTELADNAFSMPAARVYIQVEANDASASTVDNTRVNLSSNMTADTKNLNLVETSVNSGIFRGSTTIMSEENATVTIRSETDPTRLTRLQTYAFPRVSSIQPASGSNSIYLDTRFLISTSKPVDAATLNKTSVRLADADGIASYALSLVNPDQIRINSELTPESELVLRVSSDLRDTDGLPFASVTATYKTLTPQFTSLRAYSDSLFSSELAESAEIETGETVFLRITGTNAFYYSNEAATATISTVETSQPVVLTETPAGIFTGSFIVPDQPNEMLSITLTANPALERKLQIVPGFSIQSFTPASGAITVPTDIWPTWNFSRQLKPETLTSANFSLKNVADSTLIAADITLSPTGKQVRLQPHSLLPLLTEFELNVSAAVESVDGISLDSNLITRFTTQPPPPPPIVIANIANYESNEYATPTFAVATDGTLYLEVTADDTSFSTYETTRVRVDSSDGSVDGVEMALLEIAPPSGVFRGELKVDNLAPGTTFTVQAQADPSYRIEVGVFNRTVLTDITPASSSTDLYLDQPVRLSFSYPIDRLTLANGVKVLDSNMQPVDLSFAFSDADRQVVLSPAGLYTKGSLHHLFINSSLRDTNGLFLLPLTSEFATRGETSASFDLLTGIAPRDGQSILPHLLATNGKMAIVATTSTLLQNSTETRSVEFSTATQTLVAELSQITAGSYAGSIDLPAGFGPTVQAQLIFAHNPSLQFQIASPPLLLDISPASGATDVSEQPLITAEFSTMIALDSATDGLQLVSDLQTISGNVITSATVSRSINWEPARLLPVETEMALKLSGLTDYLGQVFPDYEHRFKVGGFAGISMYSDDSFAQRLTEKEIDLGRVYVEVVASGTDFDTSRAFSLQLRRGTAATTTIELPLEPAAANFSKFRCSLEIDPTRSVPDYAVHLAPGEWVELSASELTSERLLFYYRYSAPVSPVNILGIKLFSEKHYAREVKDYLQNPSLFIEVEAEDLNWVTTDVTPVRVSSDSDRRGFVVELVETGTHSNYFRGFISLAGEDTDSATRHLKARAGDRIQVVSVTNSDIRATVQYLPQNDLHSVAVFPSPARGSSVSFRFYLNFATEVNLEIFDTAGDRVFSESIWGREGENTYTWRFPRRIANGTYFYRLRIPKTDGLQTGTRRVRGSFAILR